MGKNIDPNDVKSVMEITQCSKQLAEEAVKNTTSVDNAVNYVFTKGEQPAAQVVPSGDDELNRAIAASMETAKAGTSTPYLHL